MLLKIINFFKYKVQKLKKDIKYIITSGWWSTKEDIDSRTIKKGDFYIRSKEFHKLWSDVVQNYTSAKKIRQCNNRK